MVRIRSRSVLADFLNNMARVHLLVALAVPLNVGELLAAEPDWVPATRYARLGAASVRVSEVQVGETIFIKGPPGPGRLRDSSDFIRITVSVGNSSENAKVDYESWGYTSWLVCRHRARLTDDFGNNYRPLSLDLGVQLDGQIGYRALAPGDWIKDIMYFEKPIPQATSLRLELPGSAVGERGSLKFSIPRKMWDKGYLTPAEREARRQLEAERYQKEKEERVKQAAIQLKRDAEIMAQKKAEREKQGAINQLSFAMQFEKDDKPDLARKYYTKILKDYPRTPSAEEAARLLREMPASQLRYAKALLDQGHLDRAKQRYRAIIKDYPGTKAAQEASRLLEEMRK